MCILEKILLPFIHNVYPITISLFMQENDPKQVSKLAQQYYIHVDNKINWWRTPPESPDLNPIEILWHELKEYLQR